MVIEALADHGQLRDYNDTVGLPTPTHDIDHHILRSLGEDPSTWPSDAEAQWLKVLRRAENNKPIIVGHNVSYDLCFVHAMFIWRLPDKTEDFRRRMHHLFPRVLGTKVLVSPEFDPDVVDQSLGAIFGDPACQSYPFVSSVPGWCYNQHSRSIGANQCSTHNAGFDSEFEVFSFRLVGARIAGLITALLTFGQAT
jgi:hypothetical protein